MGRVLLLDLLEACGHLVGLACSAYYAPAHAFGLAAAAVPKERARLWIVRLLANFLAAASFVALAAAPYFVLGGPGATANAGLVASSLALPTSRFYVRMRLKDRVPQLSELGLLRDVAESLVDLGAFACFCVALLTLTRLPYLYHHRHDATRRQLYVAAAMVPFDVLGLACAAAVTLSYWRLCSLQAEWEALATERPGAVHRAYRMHGVAIAEFLQLLLDVLLFLPLFLLAFVWPPEAGRMLAGIQRAGKIRNAARRPVWSAAFQAVDNWLAVLILVPVLPFFYRSRPAVPWLFVEHTEWRSCRALGQLFQLLFMDTLMLVCFLFIAVTGYRLREMWSTRHRQPFDFKNPQAQCFWFLAFLETLWDLRELPFLLLGCVITLTLWRAPALYRALPARTHPEARSRARRVVWRQFQLWLCDLPVCWLALLLLVSWRSCSFVRRLRSVPDGVDLEAELMGLPPRGPQPGDDPFRLHKAATREAAYLLMDVLVAPAALVLLLSWRSLRLRRRLRCAPEAVSGHVIVLGEALQLLIDIPHVLLAALTLWRLPLLLRALWADDNQQRRRLVRQHACWTLIDVPAALCLLLMLPLAPWHLELLRRRLEEDEVSHADVFRAAGSALVDALVLWPVLFLCCLMPWHAVRLVRRCAGTLPTLAHAEWRAFALTQLPWPFLDALGLLGAALCVVSLVRLPHLVHALRTGYAHPELARNEAGVCVAPWHRSTGVMPVLLNSVATVLCCLVGDVLMLLQLPLAVLSPWPAAPSGPGEERAPGYGTAEPERPEGDFRVAGPVWAYDPPLQPPLALTQFYRPVSRRALTTVWLLPQLLRAPIKLPSATLVLADEAVTRAVQWLRFGSSSSSSSGGGGDLGTALIPDHDPQDDQDDQHTWWAHSSLFAAIKLLHGLQAGDGSGVEGRAYSLLAAHVSAVVYAGALALAAAEIALVVCATGLVRLWLPLGGRARMCEAFGRWDVPGLPSLYGVVTLLLLATLPAVLAAQLPLLFAPLALHYGAPAWDEFLSGAFWRAPSAVWLAQVAWLVLLLPHALELTVRYAVQHRVPFYPLHAVPLTPAALAKASEQSLIRATHLCHATSTARFLFVGQLLLIPVYVVSGGWPVVAAALAFGWRPADGTELPWGSVAFCVVFALTALLSATLYVRGYLLVRKHWGDVRQATGPPALELDEVRAALPGVGVRLQLHGRKAANFVPDRVWVTLGPGSFWAAMDGIVRLPIRIGLRAFRRTQLPYAVPPHVMSLAAFQRGETAVDALFEFGCDDSFATMLNTYIITKRLSAIQRRASDPPFEVTLSYERLHESGDLERGTLCVFRSTPSRILQALGLDLQQLRDEARAAGSDIDDVSNPVRKKEVSWVTLLSDV